MPRVNYYTYSANDGTPVGLLRMVRHPQQGLWIDHVDQSGKWQDDPGALQDIYPLSDPETDESLWSQVDEVPEERAKQVYDLHFAADAKPPKQPPTATTQSQPASGSAESPSLIGPGKSVGGADPFYEGLPPDCQGGG